MNTFNTMKHNFAVTDLNSAFSKIIEHYIINFTSNSQSLTIVNHKWKGFITICFSMKGVGEKLFLL